MKIERGNLARRNRGLNGSAQRSEPILLLRPRQDAWDGQATRRPAAMIADHAEVVPSRRDCESGVRLHSSVATRWTANCHEIGTPQQSWAHEDVSASMINSYALNEGDCAVRSRMDGSHFIELNFRYRHLHLAQGCANDNNAVSRVREQR